MSQVRLRSFQKPLLAVVLCSLFFPSGLSLLSAAEKRWSLGPPVYPPGSTLDGKSAKLLDPCIVHAGNRWHVFASANGGTAYFSTPGFPASPDATLIKLPVDKCFVPQVFFFRPQARWHLIGMMPDTTGHYPKFVPCLCTNARIDDPAGWSKPEPFDVLPPEDPSKPVKNWIDFWVISDEAKCHLFATSADGRLWRSETPVNQYPHGWSKPVVALTGDFIYASHTYRQTGDAEKFITIVTARSVEADSKKGQQYQQSYVSDRLEGPWKPAAATANNPFAGLANISIEDPQWKGEIVHGEPLRSGNDERMILDNHVTSFIFHGSYSAAGVTSNDSKPVATMPCIGLLKQLSK